MRYKNGHGLKELEKAAALENSNRNLILTFAIALTIFVLFSSFSIAKGRVVIDAVKIIRERGSAASVCLENAQEKQYKQLVSLNYIKYVGKEYSIGKWYENDILFANCKAVDKTAYERMIKPAYDGIKGHYPTNKSEIMMSRRLLKKIGISKPRLGIKLSVPILFDRWSVNDGYELTEEFILTGYYDDYIEEAQYVPVVYFSEEYLVSKHMPVYPAKLPIVFKSESFSNIEMEKRLYRDIELTNAQQQFAGNDSARFLSVNQMIGGYGVAVLCSVLVLVSVYLLIYNVLSISQTKDIPYYGLLFITGLTQKQLGKLVSVQNRNILVKGVLCGAILSIMSGYAVFPILFEKLYLEQYGEIRADSVFYPEILIGAVFCMIFMMLSANSRIIRKLNQLSPIEAYHYQAKAVSPGSHKNRRQSKNGASIYKMAWYNLLCMKQKFFITIISLFLGCEIGLLGVFILNGTDAANQFTQNPDFEVCTVKDTVDVYLFPYKTTDKLNVDREKALFDERLIEKIMKIKELDTESVNEVYGCYAEFDYQEEFIQPKMDAAYGTGTSNNAVTIQVVDDLYIQKLENFVKKNELQVDTASLKNGTGILVLHKHELSELLEQDARQTVGKPAHVYALNSTGNDGTEYICSGYLDTTLKNFPALNMSWNGDGINYFLISKKGFQKMNTLKQVFRFTINARSGQEAAAKEHLVELIKEENSKQESFNIYSLLCNSDQLQAIKNYRNSTKTVMTILCLCLSLLGLTNYINVILTNIAVRKTDFLIMESIGMTYKQLRKMLILEGVYYWGILFSSLLSIGTFMTFGIGHMLKQNLSYFRFVYPVREFMMMAFILLLFCISIPQAIHKKISKTI